jgi:hypothetical protein
MGMCFFFQLNIASFPVVEVAFSLTTYALPEREKSDAPA